ncbi:MAG: class I SAM-dependent methyltransferase [Candidatus Omnitrophica bacterium]|nr:class I SAM-dependent methyltransferase [Candidatus Omnitrophota bacterium]
METEYINCYLCGADDTQLVYIARDIIWDIDGFFRVVKCNLCGFVYVNPRPTIQAIQVFYPPKYFSRISAKVNLSNIYNFKLKKILENRYKPISKYKQKGKVLEIGCGEGFFLKFLKEKGYSVFGVEISEYASNYAREVLGIDVFTGSIADFNPGKELFDIICMFEVLEHLYDPLSILLKIRYMLKDEAILVITVPNFLSFQRILFQDSWHILDVPRHLMQFTKDHLKKMLKKAGFKILALFSMSNLNHLDITTGYSQSLRYWLRKHHLYPARDVSLKSISSKNYALIDKQILKDLLKKVLHKAESILLYPLAGLMDIIGNGDNLYVCAKKDIDE